jgi:hypothetical protein
MKRNAAAIYRDRSASEELDHRAVDDAIADDDSYDGGSLLSGRVSRLSWEEDISPRSHASPARGRQGTTQEMVVSQLPVEELDVLASGRLNAIGQRNKATTEVANNSIPQAIANSDLKDDDVICERGGKSNNHVGNKRYRGLIMASKESYQEATTKEVKNQVTQSVVDEVRRRGGRFLRKHPEIEEAYMELPDDKVRTKTSQALRERKVLKLTEDPS